MASFPLFCVHFLRLFQIRERAEYCFESTVSEERELTEFCGKLGEFWEKLGEFALAHK